MQPGLAWPRPDRTRVQLAGLKASSSCPRLVCYYSRPSSCLSPTVNSSGLSGISRYAKPRQGVMARVLINPNAPPILYFKARFAAVRT